MMQDIITNYQELLFSSQNFHTYAIVDSIRDERIKEKMVFSELMYLDLWDEELFENEQKVPLYLIQLKKEDALTLWLIENHDKHAVTYFQSPYDLETLQAYYSRYTFPYVEVEAKGYEDETPRGLFGFYDPKVLPDFMQSLYTQEKREDFFAGMAVCFSPDVEETKTCHVYYLKQEGVAYRALDMRKKSRPLNVIAFQKESFPYVHSEEVPTLDARQIEIFERLNHERFVKEVVKDLHAQNLLKESTEETLPKALHIASYATTLGIDSQANSVRFIQLGLSLPNPIESYTQTKEFIALSTEDDQLKKRELLQTLLEGLHIEEVA